MADVLFEEEGPIAWIRLNRPERLNAYGMQLKAGLSAAWARFSTTQAFRAAAVEGLSLVVILVLR